MQNVAPFEVSGVDVADTTIRQLVKTANFPVSRLLAIARERIAEGPPSLEVWELAALSGEQAKPLIEQRSGPAGSSEDIAERLGLSDQTVRNMERRGELISYSALRGKGQRYPFWQLTKSDGRSVPQSWVRPLLEAYGHNGWGLIDFLVVPRTTHDGLNYLALLQRGEPSIQEVIAAARRTNAD